MINFLIRWADAPDHVIVGQFVVAFFSGFITRPIFPDSVLLGILFGLACAFAYRAAWLIFKGI